MMRIGAVAVAFSLLLTACSYSRSEPAQGADRVLVRMAVECGRDHPIAVASREIVRLADRSSDGRIRIRVYSDGYQGDELELIEQLRFGGVELAVVGSRSLEATCPSAASLNSPGRFPDTASMRTALNGEVGSRLAAELEAERLLLLAWYDGGPECFILPLSWGAPDIRGLRIGVERSKRLMDAAAAEGAVPVPISLMDGRRSLESALVGALRAPLAFALSNRFETEFRIFPLMNSRVPYFVVGSRVALMKLPESDRRTLERAVFDSRAFHEDAQSFLEKRFLRDSASVKGFPPKVGQ